MDEPLILDRYRLIERVASGGSAEVWRGHDRQLDRPVAIKRLHPHLLPDPASRKRLAAEARAVAALSHPAIVGIYDVDVGGQSPALVMELVDGESLATRIDRDGPLTEREAAAIGVDVADALYHAHQRGVIHRDVKSGNVLLGADGRTRLVDFGIAYSLAESAERLTLAGTVIGTLQSMAPEQLAGGPIGPRTDLYGIGVVLYQALTGRAPYTAASPLALVDAQRAGPPPMEGTDPALEALVRACLAHAPEERPLHAGAVAAALRAWLAGESSPALAMAPPAGTVDTSAITQPAAAASPAVATSSPVDRRSTPRRALVPLLALAALVLLGGFALAGLTGNAGIGADATATPVATPVPTPRPTPLPGWVEGLVADLARHCDAGTADAASAELAAMSEEEAKEYVKAVVEECKSAGGGDGRGDGDGDGEGNGDGNGNGGRGGGNGNPGRGDD